MDSRRTYMYPFSIHHYHQQGRMTLLTQTTENMADILFQLKEYAKLNENRPEAERWQVTFSDDFMHGNSFQYQRSYAEIHNYVIGQVRYGPDTNMYNYSLELDYQSYSSPLLSTHFERFFTDYLPTHLNYSEDESRWHVPFIFKSFYTEANWTTKTLDEYLYIYNNTLNETDSPYEKIITYPMEFDYDTFNDYNIPLMYSYTPSGFTFALKQLSDDTILMTLLLRTQSLVDAYHRLVDNPVTLSTFVDFYFAYFYEKGDPNLRTYYRTHGMIDLKSFLTINYASYFVVNTDIINNSRGKYFSLLNTLIAYLEKTVNIDSPSLPKPHLP